ncbi:hypothetical protein [Streptomyces sp. NPDC096132]|uniref:hypothetical protein n=1 Tax=Streptomyces sp. NPDC096132 TaxID=3366075 RepID=UPI00382B7491
MNESDRVHGPDAADLPSVVLLLSFEEYPNPLLGACGAVAEEGCMRHPPGEETGAVAIPLVAGMDVSEVGLEAVVDRPSGEAVRRRVKLHILVRLSSDARGSRLRPRRPRTSHPKTAGSGSSRWPKPDAELTTRRLDGTAGHRCRTARQPTLYASAPASASTPRRIASTTEGQPERRLAAALPVGVLIDLAAVLVRRFLRTGGARLRKCSP